MCFLNLKIGDELPGQKPVGIVSDRRLIRNGVPASVWHPLRVMPGKEKSAIEILKTAGVTAFCPMEKTRRFFRGKVITAERPTVTQIVYAKFQYQPLWHVMRDRGIISGVFCIGVTPIELPRDAIRILRGLPVAAERLHRAKLEMMRITPGERVKITSGPMEGFFADVTECKNGRVWWQTFLANGLPVKGECPSDTVEKLDVA